MATSSGVERLVRAARRAERRARAAEVLSRAAMLLPLPLAYAAAALTAVKLFRLPTETSRALLVLAVVPAAVAAVSVATVWFRRRPARRGSLALDRFHGFHDRVTSAITFNELPAGERTPMMQAAIEDGIAVAERLDPRRAVPVSLPYELSLVTGLVIGLWLLSTLEIRRYVPVVPPRSFEPMVMSADDLELFREALKELEAKNQDDPNARVAVGRFNRLVEDIAEHRLDRHEVFQRLGDLERDLKDDLDSDREARDAGLKGLARELEKSGLSKPAAAALDETRLPDAEKALRELAERLKKKDGRPSPAELDKLREALEKAAATSNERLKNIEARRQELEQEQKSLFKKKREAPDAGPSGGDELARNQRRLEHLDREKNQADRSQKQLSELDRALAQAARDLLRDSGQSAEDLQQGAQDINRMAKQEASDEQKQELLKKLQELRELMRQQGKAGRDQMQRLLKFGERARGQGRSQSGEEPGSEPWAPGGNKKDGPLRIGSSPGSVSVEVPMAKSVPGEGKQKPSGDEEAGGEHGRGRGAGTGHDSDLVGAPSDLQGRTHDVTAVGADTGQGTASSQVIYGAAERGFVGRGYKKVFTDYQTVAEQALTQEQIPAGYRFYVRRYFQLIRPRD